MKTKRWLLVLVLIFSLMAFMSGGCGNGDNGDTALETNGDNGDTALEPNDDENDDPSDINGSDGFVPGVAVPDGLPVYPGAELRNDLPGVGERWQWLYSTTGSGNDIVEFFVDAFQDLGFGIDSDYTFADREEFFITTDDLMVQVYWLASEDDDLNPDTPNRGYGIVVDLDRWAAR